MEEAKTIAVEEEYQRYPALAVWCQQTATITQKHSERDDTNCKEQREQAKSDDRTAEVRKRK